METCDTSWDKLAAEATYRPRELAVLCNVSLRTLQRHFSTKYNLTLTEWLRQVRLKQAYERIKAGERIKAVAYDLGFKQLSHFSRVFREVHGVPPSAIAAQADSPLKQLLSFPMEQVKAPAENRYLTTVPALS